MTWRQKRYFGFRQNKYGSRRTDCGIHSHRSGLEAKVCSELQLRQKAGDLKGFRVEVDIPLIVNGVKVTTYRADFVTEPDDGEKPEIIEAKGMVLPVFALKWKLLQAIHGDDYVFTMVTR